MQEGIDHSQISPSSVIQGLINHCDSLQTQGHANAVRYQSAIPCSEVHSPPEHCGVLPFVILFKSYLDCQFPLDKQMLLTIGQGDQ